MHFQVLFLLLLLLLLLLVLGVMFPAFGQLSGNVVFVFARASAARPPVAAPVALLAILRTAFLVLRGVLETSLLVRQSR